MDKIITLFLASLFIFSSCTIIPTPAAPSPTGSSENQGSPSSDPDTPVIPENTDTGSTEGDEGEEVETEISISDDTKSGATIVDSVIDESLKEIDTLIGN